MYIRGLETDEIKRGDCLCCTFDFVSVYRNYGGPHTVALRGKAQLNIELDTQQSFVIQDNFSRHTTIFRDTKQFLHDTYNLS